MILILSVPGRETLDNGEPAELRLDRHGAVIGRSAHADWPLPDPKNHLSSRHCEISYRDGVYLLADRSTNGTYLNGASDRLRSLHPLADGDRLIIGGYEVLVRLSGEADASASATAIASGVDGWDDWMEEAPAVPETSGSAWPTADVAERSVAADYAWEDAPMPLEASPWASRPREAVPPSAKDIWGQLARDNEIAWSRGDFGAVPEVMGAWSPPSIEGAAEAARTNATPPAPTPTGEPPVAVESWRAFAAASGLSPERLQSAPPALLAAAGAILRQMVTGLVLMVEARARAKSQLGVEGTSLELDGNNPLKFIRSPERALLQLLEPPQPGFMSAARAVEDAFQDLQAHQLATLGAMKGALHETLGRFAPAAIRERQKTGAGRFRWLPRSRDAALWRAYEQEFEGVIRGADEAFMDVFAKEFRKSYEDHVAQMRQRSSG